MNFVFLMLVQCGWCGDSLKPEIVCSPVEGVSHGMCKDCHEMFLIEADDYKAGIQINPAVQEVPLKSGGFYLVLVDENKTAASPWRMQRRELVCN